MTLKIKRGTASTRLSAVQEIGEPFYDTTSEAVYIGDGSTTGGILTGEAKIITEADRTADDAFLAENQLYYVASGSSGALYVGTGVSGETGVSLGGGTILNDSNDTVILDNGTDDESGDYNEDATFRGQVRSPDGAGRLRVDNSGGLEVSSDSGDTFTAAGAGGWALVETLTASSSSNIDFTDFEDGFDYQVTGTNIVNDTNFALFRASLINTGGTAIISPNSAGFGTPTTLYNGMTNTVISPTISKVSQHGLGITTGTIGDAAAHYHTKAIAIGSWYIENVSEVAGIGGETSFEITIYDPTSTGRTSYSLNSFMNTQGLATSTGSGQLRAAQSTPGVSFEFITRDSERTRLGTISSGTFKLYKRANT